VTQASAIQRGSYQSAQNSSISSREICLAHDFTDKYEGAKCNICNRTVSARQRIICDEQLHGRRKWWNHLECAPPHLFSRLDNPSSTRSAIANDDKRCAWCTELIISGSSQLSKSWFGWNHAHCTVGAMSELLGILHHLQTKYPGKKMPMHCHWWKTLDELKEMAGIQSLPSTISPSSEGLQSESASISPSSEGLQSESASLTESDSEADIGESSQRAPQLPKAATHRGLAGLRSWSDEEEPEPEIEIEVGVQVQVRAQGRRKVRPRARPSTVRRPHRQRRGVKRQSHAQAATSPSGSEDTSSSSDDGIDHDGGSDTDCSYHPPTACNVERSNDDPPVASTEDEASAVNLEDHASESDGIIDLIDTIDANEDTQMHEPVLDLTTPPQTVPGPGVARYKRLCKADKR